MVADTVLANGGLGVAGLFHGAMRQCGTGGRVHGVPRDHVMGSVDAGGVPGQGTHQVPTKVHLWSYPSIRDISVIPGHIRQ